MVSLHFIPFIFALTFILFLSIITANQNDQNETSTPLKKQGLKHHKPHYINRPPHRLRYHYKSDSNHFENSKHPINHDHPEHFNNLEYPQDTKQPEHSKDLDYAKNHKDLRYSTTNKKPIIHKRNKDSSPGTTKNQNGNADTSDQADTDTTKNQNGNADTDKH
ncbi:14288_t:CDS:2 [Dentiscutata heterogama]|uniref:14288_t:CDS:1 n=1 Tax=Dentiscutata heterogama TaxID=1316150 RepID=A0ACA9KPF9_9GLOM|nr:14288_t:CDS:2 [Dentiscutata heterogama]